MSWTTPKTFVTGAVLPAADLNTHLRDNLNEASVAKSTAAGDMTYAIAANSLSRVAISSSGRIWMCLTSTSLGWAPGLPNSGYFAGAIGLNRHVESGSVQTSTDGTLAVSFTDSFAAEPNVVCTLIGSSGSGGETVVIASPGTTGFTMYTYSGATPVQRWVKWIAEGVDT